MAWYVLYYESNQLTVPNTGPSNINFYFRQYPRVIILGNCIKTGNTESNTFSFVTCVSSQYVFIISKSVSL